LSLPLVTLLSKLELIFHIIDIWSLLEVGHTNNKMVVIEKLNAIKFPFRFYWRTAVVVKVSASMLTDVGSINLIYLAET